MRGRRKKNSNTLSGHSHCLFTFAMCMCVSFVHFFAVCARAKVTLESPLAMYIWVIRAHSHAHATNAVFFFRVNHISHPVLPCCWRLLIEGIPWWWKKRSRKNGTEGILYLSFFPLPATIFYFYIAFHQAIINNSSVNTRDYPTFWTSIWVTHLLSAYVIEYHPFTCRCCLCMYMLSLCITINFTHNIKNIQIYT